MMMPAIDHQAKPLRLSDIISHTVDFSSFLTNAKIDATCNRTLHGSNVVNSVDTSTSTTHISLKYLINNRITRWLIRQGKGSARTAPRLWFLTLPS